MDETRIEWEAGWTDAAAEWAPIMSRDPAAGVERARRYTAAVTPHLSRSPLATAYAAGFDAYLAALSRDGAS